MGPHPAPSAPCSQAARTPSPAETICRSAPQPGCRGGCGAPSGGHPWSHMRRVPRTRPHSQPSVRRNKGRRNRFVNTSVTARETDKPGVQSSFLLLRTNSGRKTTSLPPFFPPNSPASWLHVFSGIQKAVDVFSSEVPGRSPEIRPASSGSFGDD